MDESFSRINHPILNRILQVIPASEPVYLVGGAIRDTLLNRPIYDLDFVIPGDAMKLARHVADDIGAAYFPLDARRNIARLIHYTDKSEYAKVNFPRRIDFSSYQGKNLDEDLRGRDFTINAMAIEIHQPQILIDPLGGASDLVKKHLKACSQNSFHNDPVRILRAVRFSVELELSILPETLKLIRQSVNLLQDVSPERQRDELFRILAQSQPSSSIRLLDKLNALEGILPELIALKNIHQPTPHIMDVWEHTLDCLMRLEDLLDVLSLEFNPEKAGNLMLGLVALRLGRFREQMRDHLNNSLNSERPHRAILFMAALYHDSGKAITQKVGEDGKIRFIEHEQIGSRLVGDSGKTLRLSNHENERLMSIVKHHMRPTSLSHDNNIPSRKAIYRFFRDTGDAGVDICLLSMADLQATYGPTLPQERWACHLDTIRELFNAWWVERDERVKLKTLVDGDDLKNELGIPPGPLVGYLLEAVREAQAAGEVESRLEAIRLAKKLTQ